jgi:hypothetical protein
MEINQQWRQRYWLTKLEQEGLKELRLDKATAAKVKQALKEARDAVSKGR